MADHKHLSLSPQPSISKFPLYQYKGPFDKAITIANHYGFHLIRPVPVMAGKKISTASRPHAQHHIATGTSVSHIPLQRKVASLRHYIDNLSTMEKPVMVCHTRNPRRKTGQIVLEVFGSNKSIAEALLLRTATAILKEYGYPNVSIDINSFGTREARAQLTEELLNFFRKYERRFPEEDRDRFKKNIFSLMAAHEQVEMLTYQQVPTSLNFLTDRCRTHLKEVVEYIEEIGVPYQVNCGLIGCKQSLPVTVFRITHEESPNKLRILARGERYDYLAFQLRKRKPIPSVAIEIDLSAGQHESYKKSTVNSKPKIFYMHLGMDAKRVSLSVLEILRGTGIPLTQSLTNDSLINQMALAERINVPFVVILGLKEVNERTVIIRNMTTHAQEVVPIASLDQYIKRLVK